MPKSLLCGCGLPITDPRCCTNSPEVIALVARDEAMQDALAAIARKRALDAYRARRWGRCPVN